MDSIKTLERYTLIFTLILFQINVAVAGVYKWTDQNGKVHFSDKPQPNALQIEVNTTQSSGIGASSERLLRQKELLLDYQNNRDNKKSINAKKRNRDNKIQIYCRRLKNKLLNYNEVDYLFIRNAEGKKKRLSSQQKQQEITALEKKYAEHCS